MHFCKSCNYSTPLAYNYKRHCKTKKHLSNTLKSQPGVNQKSTKSQPKVNQKSTKSQPKWFCEHCDKYFKHKQSYYLHKSKRCRNKPVIQNINNINNITNNTNNTNNNLNIILKVGSVEEAEKIKSLLTPEVIMKLCEPKRMGYPWQTYDMIKNISNYSLQLKQNNKELQNFKKTNARDNIIDVYDDDQWNKKFFDDYIRNDLQKYADIILKKCEDKSVEPDISRYEKLEIIKEVCQNYEKYKKIDQEDMDGIILFTLDAIDEQIKEHKLLHYNITTNNNTRASNEDNKDI